MGARSLISARWFRTEEEAEDRLAVECAKGLTIRPDDPMQVAFRYDYSYRRWRSVIKFEDPN